MIWPFCRRPRRWVTPSGRVCCLYEEMAAQPHLLIAGATGSGKSVLVNGIISTLLYRSPESARFILIDPKRVELLRYRNLPHTLAHASEPDTMRAALAEAMRITDERYRDMAARGLLEYDGGHIYVIIDELADLMTTDKRRVLPLLQRLCQVGRAAHVHVIGATQCPLASVIPTAIKVNFSGIVGLRTATRQHSRNIIDRPGCELLPDPRAAGIAQGYYVRGALCELYNLPMVPAKETAALIDWWTSKKSTA